MSLLARSDLPMTISNSTFEFLPQMSLQKYYSPRRGLHKVRHGLVLVLFLSCPVVLFCLFASVDSLQSMSLRKRPLRDTKDVHIVSQETKLHQQVLPAWIAHLPPDYSRRAALLGLAEPIDVRRALKDPSTYVIDVRSKTEIAKTSHFPAVSNAVITTHCHACPDLETVTQLHVPKKDTTIVLYCGSGKRASAALSKLKTFGYTNVLNAGGLKDVLAILNDHS